MEKKKSIWKDLFNNFEMYVGAVIFVILTVLLFLQVVSRYLLAQSFTWAEELGTILFVWMTYLGVASAVTHRKHLKIDAFLIAMPFKVRKALLIISNVIFFVFSLYIISPMMDLVYNFASKDATSSILLIPKALYYFVMPLCFGVTAFRLIQDTLRLFKEEEKELGASAPTIDMEALEAEAAEFRAQREKMQGGNQ